MQFEFSCPSLTRIAQLYRETLELIGDKLGPPEQIRDNEWMDRTQVQIYKITNCNEKPSSGTDVCHNLVTAGAQRQDAREAGSRALSAQAKFNQGEGAADPLLLNAFRWLHAFHVAPFPPFAVPLIPYQLPRSVTCKYACLKTAGISVTHSRSADDPGVQCEGPTVARVCVLAYVCMGGVYVYVSRASVHSGVPAWVYPGVPAWVCNVAGCRLQGMRVCL